MKKEFELFTNDKNGKTIVVVSNGNGETAFDAQKIANKHFKGKTNELHVCAGIRKGKKVESLDDLNAEPNCWMVWR